LARLDAFLKNTGLFKARTQARKACDEGRVQIDGEAARGSRSVHVGARLLVETGGFRIDAEVLDVPERPVARSRRGSYLTEHGREPLDREVLSFDDEP
jgi:ribosomal 50S subunit-recycling heat shock protein|tara:strand:- start:226 stop:519 length:294 start_codon:yes stop_codon:yes gene_type:complete